jgi:hypothetical protein
MDGFLVGNKVNGRPADIYRIDANSFYFSDDKGGVVYYVRKKGPHHSKLKKAPKTKNKF